MKRCALLGSVMLFVSVMFACNSSDNPLPLPNHVDGGPCEYETIKFTATVTSIEHSVTGVTKSELTPYFHVELSFNRSTLSIEPQYLEEFVPQNIDSAFLARNNIGFGTEFTGTIREITKGTCSPFSISFDQKFE